MYQCSMIQVNQRSGQWARSQDLAYAMVTPIKTLFGQSNETYETRLWASKLSEIRYLKSRVVFIVLQNRGKAAVD